MTTTLFSSSDKQPTKNERVDTVDAVDAVDTVDTVSASAEPVPVTVTREEQDTTAPLFNAAKVNGDTLVLTYDSELDDTNTPSVEDFEVMKVGKVGTAARKVEVSEVAISGKTVTLTLENPVLQDQMVKLKYTDPGKANDLNAIQDLSGNNAGSFSGKEVVNNTKDKTAPVFVKGEVKKDGATLVLTYRDDSLLKETAPSGNAFTVSAGDEEIKVDGVPVVDPKHKTVTLTLAKPVLQDQVVTLDYTVPAKNAIQDDKGNKAETLGPERDDRSVYNNSTKTPPTFNATNATVNKDRLVLTYDRVMDEAIDPSAKDFTVTVGKDEVMVSRVEVQGKKVTLTLATPAQYDQVVTVSYTAGKIQDTAGIEAPSQGQDEPVTVTNNTPNAAPTFSGANVDNAKLTITFADDQGLDPGHVPPPEAFTVKGGKEPIKVDQVIEVNDTSVTLVLERPVLQGEKLVLSYDGKSLQDVVGGIVKGFNNKPVGNDTEDTTPPTFKAAEVTGKGQVVLTFTDDYALKNNNPSPGSFAITVDGAEVSVTEVGVDAKGKTVTLTLAEPVKYQQQVVNLTYQPPANKAAAIQDDNGNDVSAFNTRNISNSTTPDNTPPTFDKATVNGTDLTVRYSEQYSLDSKNLPDVSAFTVEADGVAIAVKDIAVNARNLSLTLKTPVEYQQAVTVAYRDPGKGNDAAALQDAAGNDAASLPATAVENRTPDTTPPEFVKAEINEAQLVLSYDEKDLLDASNLPPASAFAVKVDGSTRAVSDVIVNAKARTMTLTLENSVHEGQEVVLSYADAKGNDTNTLQDQSGNDANSFKGVTVENKTQDTTPPNFTGATVNQSKLVLSYADADEARLDAVHLPAADAFNVKVDGVDVATDAVAVDAKTRTVTLTLAKPVAFQQAVTLAYSDPTSNDDDAALQDQFGNDAISLARVPVDNQTPDTTAPVFVKGLVSGDTVSLTYTDVGQLDADAEHLPSTANFSVRVDGTAVAVTDILVDGSAKTVSLTLATPVLYQQAVTVAYRDPGKGNDAAALQDAAGNDAPGLPTTPFANLTPDSTPPVFVQAQIDESLLVLDYSDAQPLDIVNLPPVSAFTVKVDGKVAAVNSVKLDSNTIQLDLANPVLPKQAVTVAYRDPGKANDTNAIQDKVGNDAPSLGATSVSNTTRFYTLNVTDPVYTEAGDSAQTMTYVLSLDRVPTVPVTINYATLDTGTAIPNEDFNMTSGTIVFEPGQIQASVSIPVNSSSDRTQPLIDKTLDVEFSSNRLTDSITTHNFTGDNTMIDKKKIRFTTSAQDNLLGTVDDDGSNNENEFVAEITNSLQGTATNTLSGGDYANGDVDDPTAGGKKVDRLILTATDARPNEITSVIGFELENIEELEIRAYDTDGNSKKVGQVELGLVNVSGLEKILSSTSDANITLKTVQNLVELDITGNGFSGTVVTLNYINDVTTGDKTTQIINLRGFGEDGVGNQGRISVNGAEVFQISAMDKDSIIQLDSDTLKTINMTLNQDLKILNPKLKAKSFLDTLTTVKVDNADLTGSLTADFSDSSLNMTVTTGDGSDDIKTGSGNDKIDVKDGNNTVKAGNNTVEISDGNDTITAGDGNDTIDAGRGFNVIEAGNGNNKVTTGSDNDTITTGSGDDTVDAGGSVFIDDDDDSNDKDVVKTGEGNDVITLGIGDNLIEAGEGNDTVELGVNLDRADTIDGGIGSNTIKVPNIDSINDPGDFDNVSNFETLVFTKASSGAINADSAGIEATNLNDVGISTYTFSKGLAKGDVFINQVTAPDGENITVNLTTGTTGKESLTATAKNPGPLLNMALNVTNNQGGLVDETLTGLTLGGIKALALDFQDGNLKDKGEKEENKVDSLIIKGMTADSLEKLTLSGNGDIRIEGTISSTVIKTVQSTVATANIQVDVSRATSGVSMAMLGGADTLVSGNEKDTISSGDGSDSISSGDGADTIEAGNGNNIITAGDGADTVTAGAGADNIDAGKGNDVVLAGAGNDTITAGSGIDNLDGDAGDDTFNFTYSTIVEEQGLTSADIISGGNGEDKVVILEESATDVTLVDDIFFQWSNVETLDISEAIDSTDADTQAGSVTLNAIALRASLKQVITGAGDDYVAIGEGFKKTEGLTVEIREGADTIQAGAAPSDSLVIVYVPAASPDNLNLEDDLNAGGGNKDTLRIQANDAEASTDATNFERIDIVDGRDTDLDGEGDASIKLTVTDKVVKPGQTFEINATELGDVDAKFTFDGSLESDGRFNLTSGVGGDTLTGGSGADILDGGNGANSINGGAGNDSIVSGRGFDTLDGGTGNDTLISADGNDSLSGGEGDDVLQGQNGADNLVGGLGKDTLTGSEGNDKFWYTRDDINVTNVDTIIDFGSSDAIVFTGIAGVDTISRSTSTTAVQFKGNFNSFGAAQGAVAKGVEGTTANDGIIEAVYQTDSNTLWIDLNEDAALNADDLQIILTGTASLAQTNFMVG